MLVRNGDYQRGQGLQDRVVLALYVQIFQGEGRYSQAFQDCSGQHLSVRIRMLNNQKPNLGSMLYTPLYQSMFWKNLRNVCSEKGLA